MKSFRGMGMTAMAAVLVASVASAQARHHHRSTTTSAPAASGWVDQLCERFIEECSA